MNKHTSGSVKPIVAFLRRRVTFVFFFSSSFSCQRLNAPPRSKMKLWKSATFAFVLCGAALSLILVRNMATTASRRPKAKSKQQASSSSSTSFSSRHPSFSGTPSSLPAATLAGALHRRTRSADNMNSLLSECKTHMCHRHHHYPANC